MDFIILDPEFTFGYQAIHFLLSRVKPITKKISSPTMQATKFTFPRQHHLSDLSSFINYLRVFYYVSHFYFLFNSILIFIFVHRFEGSLFLITQFYYLQLWNSFQAVNRRKTFRTPSKYLCFVLIIQQSLGQKVSLSCFEAF